MSAEIVRVPFHGDDILTVEIDGKPHVILKPAIEALGLDYWAQVRKLRERSWACTASKAVQLPGDNQRRDVVTADVRTFLMLLATVDERRVSEDVAPKLREYQSEVADAIERYWIEGGALNPRASREQLAEVVDLATKRMTLLQAAAGLVDPAWLEAKTRHELARGLGEEPEVDASRRPLTVGEYLEGRGIRGAAQRSMSAMFGKRVKKLYRDSYGEDPKPTERFVDGALRQVAGYTEEHRHLFDAVWSQVNSGGAA